MPDLDIVGTAAVDVVPIAPGFHDKLRAMVLPSADRVGEQAGRRLGDAIADAMMRQVSDALPRAVTAGGTAAQRAATRQGSDTGGAFARSLRVKLEAAFRAMPRLDVRLSDTGVDAELARIRAKLEQLSNKRIGIDVSVEAAAAEVERLEAQLRELGAQHPNVAVRADTATARAALAQFRAEIDAIGDRRTVALEVDGAFGARLRAAVEAAQASIPDINVDADTSPARAEVQELRGQLAALADQRVGIDVDAREALAEVGRIQERLAILSIQRHDVDVRVDAGAAAAELAALQAMADRTRVVRITALADTSQASGAFMHLGIQIAALTAIPLGPVLVAGLGAVVSMAAAAGAGVGAVALAAVPAIKGVGEALKAKTAAEDDASRATAAGERAAVQASQRALQMAGAQQALSAAHRNAARSIQQANRQVEDAERAVAQTVQRAADQRRQSAEAIRQAERGLADAHRNVRQAQESLTDANRSARSAEDDLTAARAAAADQLRELNSRLADGALDQREAALRVREAQAELAATLRDPQASALDREGAQLAYDRAVANAERQKRDYAELQKAAQAQQKAGVDGSDEVRAAAERLAQAQRTVRDRTDAVAEAQDQVRERARAVADAHSAAARAQSQAAQEMVDAQRRVADATENVAAVQVAAAESIESAERGIASARLSGVAAAVTAKTKADEYREALAKLTPEQRALFDSIAGPRGLKSAFDAWQKSLQPHVLPLFTRGVDGAKNSLPGLTPLVIAAADGIGELMDRASAEMKTPFWQDFKRDIAESAKPAIVGLGVAFGNVVKGMAGVISAFLPHMDGIAQRSDSITERFAKWGTSLKGSPQFEKFLAYVKETAPGLGEFLGNVLTSTLDVAKALGSLSGLMFEVLSPLLESISWLAENAPGAIQLIFGIYVATKTLALGMAAFGAAMAIYQIAVAGATLVTAGWAAAINATGIVPVIRAIVIVIGLLVAGLIYAYNNWDWFRNGVDAAIDGIATAASWVWNSILKPVFSGIWTAIKAAGEIAMWLWDTAIRPAFRFIGEAAKFLVTALITFLLLPAYLAFKVLGAIALWLWDKAIGPAFRFIGDVALWLWNTVLSPVFKFIGDAAVWLYEKAIKPAFAEAKKKFDVLGIAANWLWDKVLRPVFDFIGDKAGWLYDKAIKPAFDNIKFAMALVSAAFETGKEAIKKAWDQVQNIAKKPVRFILEHVYNGGIVPLWNRVAGITGAKKLEKLDLKHFATGGIMPGYTPGRDNQLIAVGGGEAIMRPEWTRAVGEDTVHTWNAAARRGGVEGVRRAIAAGMPAYADGGIAGWFKDKANSVGSFITGAAEYVNPVGLFDKARTYVLNQMKGIAENPWARMLTNIPSKILTALKEKALSYFDFGGDGSWIKPINAPYGTPFGKRGSMWSSGRHTGLDFPAAVGTLIKAVADGRVTQVRGSGPYGNHAVVDHGRGLTSLYAHMSTVATLAGRAIKQGDKIGEVGVTGNTSGPHLHLEARRHGVAIDPMTMLAGGGNVSGSKAVGSAQTIAMNMLGNYGWGPSQFPPLKKLWDGESGWRWNATNPASGAYGIPQALPAEKMRSAGADWRTNPATQIRWGLQYIQDRPDYGSPAEAYRKWLARSPHWYDDGGYLPPGLSLVANGTGAPEPVFTSAQWDTLRANVGRAGTPTEIRADVKVFVGTREITDIVDTRIDLYDARSGAAIETGGRL
jgi:murein DD-endopeptidase MepM/ murein hydrolase activator NlpD